MDNAALGIPYATPDGAPFWTGARDGRLLFQKCKSCERHRFPPAFLCRHCHSEDAVWSDVSGSGVVHSFTVVHRAPSQAWRGRTPYVIALVDLDHGLRVMANILCDDGSAVAIGDAVDAAFEARGETVIPQFRKVEVSHD